MILQPHETELTGQWIAENGEVRGDAACERINWLVTSHLEKLAFSPESGGWDTLFRDPGDGRYWERIYPQSELHGGGPPQLLCLSKVLAFTKYRIRAP
jgi:hypothetical protein